MKDKFKELTDNFGKLLIKEVRDKTIYQGHEQVNTLQDEYFTNIYNKLSNLRQEQIEIIKDIIIDSIDNTLTNFLWAIDQDDQFDIIAYERDLKKFHSLKDINTGLYDEYFYFVQDISRYKTIEILEHIEGTKVKQFPDERIMALISDNISSEAKREFVKVMNNKTEFNLLKQRLHHIPKNIVDSLIERTLSTSSFHKNECEELRRLISSEH